MSTGAELLMPAPRPGQIWRENDPRKERYIRVLAVDHSQVKIITVDKNTRTPVKGARLTVAEFSRFGKYARGCYSFVEAPTLMGS